MWEKVREKREEKRSEEERKEKAGEQKQKERVRVFCPAKNNKEICV